MNNEYILLAIAVMLVIVCGCAGSSTTNTSTTVVTTQTTQPLTGTTTQAKQTTDSVSANTVLIKNFAFNPANITVKAGATVRWENKDSVPHRILFADGTYSQVLAASDSWSRKIDRAGTYDYSCTIHPAMKGTVIVE